MNISRIVLFEDRGYVRLLPLVYWRSVGELRCGYGNLLERTTATLGAPVTDLWVRRELAAVTGPRHHARTNQAIGAKEAGLVLLINARYLRDTSATAPRPNTIGAIEDQISFACLPAESAVALDAATMMSLTPEDAPFKDLTRVEADGHMITYPWDLIAHNGRLLRADWPGSPDCQGQVAETAHLIRPENIFVGPHARIMPAAVLDASEGPIHVGTGVTVSPLAIVRGPTYIGEGSLLKPGAVIGPACSIGPLCKLGGEIEATIIQGFTSKQHEGFLGHAYLGQWVNLGAGTVNSDLKNTYGPVRVPINGQEIDTGLTFVGAFIADHVKTGIGQTISTGSVIGFAANVATSAFPPKFVPSFSWMTDKGTTRYDPQRCLAVAKKVMKRRNQPMSDAEESLFLRLPVLCAELESTPTG